MDISRLARLHGVALVRKCALLLEAVERESAAAPEAAASGYARAAAIAAFLAGSPEASPEAAKAATAYLAVTDYLEATAYSTAAAYSAAAASAAGALRSLNSFRHALRLASGQSTADWDLVDHNQLSEEGGRQGHFVPGLRVFLEDIRSPFNVGTILRTAEAFGFEEVLLSSDCADPRHPRAARSSMGAVDLIPWRRCSLPELQDLGPLLALELGGVHIDDFSFPAKAVLVLGSEELGISDPALVLAGQRRLTIPMLGAKASINVAVAFGIAAHAWVASISP